MNIDVIEHEAASAVAGGTDKVGSNQASAKSREPNIGQMLLETGKIAPEDAERVLRYQREHGLRFGDAAIELGLVTAEDIQLIIARQFHYPYLAAHEGAYSDDLIAAYKPFSAGVEALRLLRAQLLLRWFSQGHKSLVIMSLDSGEGVSYIAANLAVVFSQLGERTLLIDANLRKPKQNAMFNLRERKGFSDVLGDRSWTDSIVPIDSFVSLSVIPAGTEVPNPQELLNRHTFKKFSDTLEVTYDTVLYDSPSFSAGADALTLASKIGGVLIVARKNHSRMSGLTTMCEQLKGAGATIVGSVFVEF